MHSLSFKEIPACMVGKHYLKGVFFLFVCFVLFFACHCCCFFVCVFFCLFVVVGLFGFFVCFFGGRVVVVGCLFCLGGLLSLLFPT